MQGTGRRPQARIGAHDLIACRRCGKEATLSHAAAAGWNFETRGGRITGFVCHDCQTWEDAFEADIMAEIYDYGRMWFDADGRAHAPIRPIRTGGGDAA